MWKVFSGRKWVARSDDWWVIIFSNFSCSSPKFLQYSQHSWRLGTFIGSGGYHDLFQWNSLDLMCWCCPIIHVLRFKIQFTGWIVVRHNWKYFNNPAWGEGSSSTHHTYGLDWLISKFGNPLISHKTDRPWPPRSPDAPPVFLFWGMCLAELRRTGPGLDLELDQTLTKNAMRLNIH